MMIHRWKYKDGEEVYYRLGVSVYRGTVRYTESLPALTNAGEECYHIACPSGRAITCACNVYREKEAAIKDALAEIHREYLPWVRQYMEAMRALEEV